MGLAQQRLPLVALPLVAIGLFLILNYTTSSTLSLKTTTPDGKKYFQADDVDISGIASGTNLKLKIVVTNNTCTALHGWVLDWS